MPRFWSHPTATESVDIMDSPSDSPFVGNYFCLIPNTDLAFVMISKNAVTFLKRVALFNATGEWSTDQRMTHVLIGDTPSSPYLVPVDAMPEWEAEHGRRVKFAVWRDPIRRIESAYSLACLDGVHLPHLAAAGLYVDPSEEHFRRFVTFETSKHPRWTDAHFRAQADYFAPDDVDAVIGIRDLQPFLAAHEVPFVPEISNASKNNHYRITDEAWRTELRTIYARDYAIDVLDLHDAIARTLSQEG